MSVMTGKRNLITDVKGIRVGNAQCADLLSGVTVIVPEGGAVAGVDVRGGGPATRETDALTPNCLIEHIHAISLSGGSVFGLAAADGVAHALAQKNIGFSFGDQPLPCPVVPAACLFDLTNGGDKNWGEVSPYRALGISACEAAGEEFDLGNAGAGLGAVAGTLKGGLGSASVVWNAVTVAALSAVNSFGSAVVPRTDILWASPYVRDNEYLARSVPPLSEEGGVYAGTKAETLASAARPGGNTTLCVVATDAQLTKAQAERIAIMAGDGMARALRPVHTPFDGDLVFALATGASGFVPDAAELGVIGGLAADCVARAIARGVWEARAVKGHAALRGED